ncbi:hypothetical protein [Singulisphaera sp. PoT]|uniref:hypothetical protein n=1 Tax=Singulisphaera sp. PoT TaxID=3411797 RepID=UPI003BF52F19
MLLLAPLRLTIFGSSSGDVTGANGKLLDGDHDGQAGGDYVALIRRRVLFALEPVGGAISGPLTPAGGPVDASIAVVSSGPGSFSKPRRPV